MGATMTEQAEQSVAIRVLKEELKRLEFEEESYLERRIQMADMAEAVERKVVEIATSRAEVEQAILDLTGATE